MAKQVRPWLANPDTVRAQKVRLTDRGVNQQIPSGTVGANPQPKSERTGAIFTYQSKRIGCLAKGERSCVDSADKMLFMMIQRKVARNSGLRGND